jgi:peroxiredoxin
VALPRQMVCRQAFVRLATALHEEIANVNNPSDPSHLTGPLPAEDDSVARRLCGAHLPDLALPSTSGGEVTLSRLGARTVLYLYPMTGRPGIPLPNDWDLIPGARGCTAEACAFRDHFADLQAAGAGVFGLSSQSTADQQEAVTRLRLPFPLLSDDRLELGDVLRLPTFEVADEVDERRLYRRLTLVVRDGVVEHVFYPVVPPDQHAEQVLAWVREQRVR